MSTYRLLAIAFAGVAVSAAAVLLLLTLTGCKYTGEPNMMDVAAAPSVTTTDAQPARTRRLPPREEANFQIGVRMCQQIADAIAKGYIGYQDCDPATEVARVKARREEMDRLYGPQPTRSDRTGPH